MEDSMIDGENSNENCENNGEFAQEMEVEVETCRICDEVCEKMYNIFEDNPDGYQLIGLIKENLPIILYKSDPLSKQVCEKCFINLQLISSIKKLSRKTQEKYIEKLKTEGDTTDKNILLFLGCTGSKLINNGVEDEEEEEDELRDVATSTDDLTILCANCKTAILDACTVNGELELRKISSKSVHSFPPEISLRKRKCLQIYPEFEDSLSSNLTDRNTPANDDDLSQYNTEVDSEDSSEQEQHRIKRRKIDMQQEEIDDEELSKANEIHYEDENEKEAEISPEQLNEYAEQFKNEPTITYEPLSLMNIVLNFINSRNLPDYQPIHYKKISTICACNLCGEKFQNAKLLALHEPTHMTVEVEEKIDEPNLWPLNQPYASIRNKWLNNCTEEMTMTGESSSQLSALASSPPPPPPPPMVPLTRVQPADIVDKEMENMDATDNIGSSSGAEDEEASNSSESENKVDPNLLVESSEKTINDSKKNEVILVDMKPIVNGIYLGDYSKEDRKAFYQCMRIGGQTKRFCPLCRYCFKDNWAIESHYFSMACYYTCRYCGMRFNKQRHRFDDHVEEHKLKQDSFSEKIFTASKVNNTMPKIIQPDRVRRVISTQDGTDSLPAPPVMPPKESKPKSNTQQGTLRVKDDLKEASPKTQNQAYFCRKCYKVFFKLDEFNAHSKNCDYSQFSAGSTFRGMQSNSGSGASSRSSKSSKTTSSRSHRNNGEYTNTGRPLRNCAKDIGPYKDEVYIPKQILNETLPGPPQSFVCHICGTPFPTIYSRNSHMRIHKGETSLSAGSSPNQNNILKHRLQQQQTQHQQNIQMHRAIMQQQQRQMYQQQRQQQNNYSQYEEIKVKQEPVDSFEPMVEIHEGLEEPPHTVSNNYTTSGPPRELGGGAVSITPIIKPKSSELSPSILKIMQNNPNISISKRSSKDISSSISNRRSSGSNSGGSHSSTGYQGPYAPNAQNNSQSVSPGDDKSYKCSSCWEAFTNKSHLYFHKKNQCEGSRYPCPFCKKRFGTEAAYSSHIFYSHPE